MDKRIHDPFPQVYRIFFLRLEAGHSPDIVVISRHFMLQFIVRCQKHGIISVILIDCPVRQDLITIIKYRIVSDVALEVGSRFCAMLFIEHGIGVRSDDLTQQSILRAFQIIENSRLQVEPFVDMMNHPVFTGHHRFEHLTVVD